MSDEPLSEWNAQDAELLRRIFLEEAEGYLRHIADAQQRLSHVSEAEGGGVVEAEVIDGLFRHLHTLKGSAGSVGFNAISHAAHDLEDLCAEMRAGNLAATPGIIARIDEGVTGLRALLDGARAAPATSQGEASPTPMARMAERRQSTDRRGVSRRHGERVLRVDSERLDALLDGVGDLVILRTRIERRLRDLQSVMGDMDRARGGLRTLASEVSIEKAAGSGPAPQTAARFRALVDRVGEIEVEFTDAIAYLERASQALTSESESLRRTSDHLEEQLRRARLVPLEWIFGRLASALRELERNAGCQADLEVTGSEIELDKSVIDQLTDPLLHLLRNAIAHGIETPGERAARGKHARGRITINARQEGEFAFLQFEDDGRGIDREQVRRALVREKRLTESEPLKDELLLSAIFEPGFSSRLQSDALAGRGMGLNIVKKALVQLGGDVRVEYQPGVFTRFSLSVPLTGSIIQGLLFKVGGQVYAVPAMNVVEALPIGIDERQVAHSGGRVDPSPLPVLKLQSLLGVEIPPGPRLAALHVRYGERSFILTCDRIIGPRTIVVRPLGPLLGHIPLYAGVTISGSGKAQLVFDLGALFEAAYTHSRAAPQPARRGRPRILVVDDSRLAREAAARVLVAAGYQPITAEDGWEAWEMVSERRFDAVVTDLEMPRMDGYDLIVRIRGEATLRGLPVVVYSSRTSETARARAIDAGANTVLPKIPNKRVLVDALAALLGDTPSETVGS